MKKVSGTGLVMGIACVILHLLATWISEFGIFRDEFYYLACSEHLALGYVDHPPLSIFLLKVSTSIFGDSKFAIRIIPAICHGLTIYISALMVYRMGGKVWARLMTILAVFLAPIILGITGFYSMNALDLLFWSVAAYQLMRISVDPSRRNWLFMGVILGFALLNKISILWWGTGLFLAIIFESSLRKDLLNGKAVLAGILAFAIFSLHIYWQVINGWPTLEFMENATSNKMIEVSAVDFFVEQITSMNPLVFPIYIVGLYALLFHRRFKTYRSLGIIFSTVVIILVASGTSRSNYLTPAYLPLIAAGATLIERFFAQKNLVWLSRLYVALIFVSGLILIPLSLPILPIDSYLAYQTTLGMEPTSAENTEIGPLPQHYADTMEWEELAKTVSAAYMSLPASERKGLVIYASNYGEAGALNYYARDYPLPKTISSHNNFWIWANEDIGAFENIIRLNHQTPERLQEVFKEVRVLGQSSCEFCMPYENNLQITFCKDPKFKWEEIWDEEKRFH